MKVPLAVPDLSGREAEYVQECISSTFVSTAGPFVARFEAEIASLSGAPDAVALCSGTTALHLALEQLGIGRGDLVMIPSLTFIATANAVRHTGADVWLVDCHADDWTFDVGLAREVLERETVADPEGGRRRRDGSGVVRALMPVMIMGATLPFKELVGLAREYGLRVVVDAAAAIGATGEGDEPLCATGVDAVCYSFNGNKTVTTGGGGAVASDDPDLVERIRHVSTTGRVGPNYDHDVVAYNFRMTNVEAAIGVAQLERLETFLARKRVAHLRYASLADEFAELAPFPTPSAGRTTHWFSGLVYVGDDLSAAAEFRACMVEGGIDVRPFWKPVHQQSPYRDAHATTMANTDAIWDRIVPLPCSSGITDEELDHVVGTARGFWASRDRSRAVT